MIEFDEDALICDLAETYHIFDYKLLPPKTVATLAAGLRDNSRIKLRAAGVPVALDTILLASIADRLDSLRYGFFKDVERNTPFAKLLLGKNDKEALSFGTVSDFQKAYAKAIGEDNE